jgi:methylthioribose-1-phosphate isomerase
MAPAEMIVRNPAFDITPHRLVAAMMTEAGVIRPPYAQALRRVVTGRAEHTARKVR